MVELNTHKLLAMAVLDDNIAPLVSANAGDAFWRGFLLEDRKTGKYSFTYRFKYANNERSWTTVTFVKSRHSLEDLIEEIKLKMCMALLIPAKRIKPDIGPEVFHWHEVPVADREDPKRTMIWMEMQDLVHAPKFESIKEGGNAS